MTEQAENNEAAEAPPQTITPGELDKITHYFAPCGRCGHFWVGYRVLAGEELQTAVQQTDDGWLRLAWRQGMRNLLLKSYGSRLDVDHLHFAGVCKECRRDFTFSREEEDASPRFMIRLLPV